MSVIFVHFVVAMTCSIMLTIISQGGKSARCRKGAVWHFDIFAKHGVHGKSVMNTIVFIVGIKEINVAILQGTIAIKPSYVLLLADKMKCNSELDMFNNRSKND